MNEFDLNKKLESSRKHGKVNHVSWLDVYKQELFCVDIVLLVIDVIQN
jgi:hypothetical protein